MTCCLHLVRHAEHALQGQTLTGRALGVTLSTLGRQQADALARHYRTTNLAAVISSPVQRARETAAPIAASRGLPVDIEPGLDEVDFGDWTGLRFDLLHGQPAWADWNAARILAFPPGGEAMLAVQARALAAVQAIAARFPDGTAVVVSHADVIKAVLAAVLGMPLDLLHRMEVLPASRSILTLGIGWGRVDGINLPA